MSNSWALEIGISCTYSSPVITGGQKHTHTLRARLKDLLKKAHEELESDFMLPEEFQYSTIPEINIHRRVPKLPGQPGSQFRDYLQEMQEA
jgi:hypothetical protein